MGCGGAAPTASRTVRVEDAWVEDAGRVEGVLDGGRRGQLGRTCARGGGSGALATPTPCSAEIVPPRSAAAVEHLVGDRRRVAGLEHVEVDVALGEVAERHQPAAVAGDRATGCDHELAAAAPTGTATSSFSGTPCAAIDSVIRSRNATRRSRAGPSVVTAASMISGRSASAAVSSSVGSSWSAHSTTTYAPIPVRTDRRRRAEVGGDERPSPRAGSARRRRGGSRRRAARRARRPPRRVPPSPPSPSPCAGTTARRAAAAAVRTPSVPSLPAQQ